VVIGMFAAFYLIITRKGPWWLWVIAILWLSYYTLKSQTLNGYVLTAILGLFSWIYLILKIELKAVKIGLSVGLLAMLIGGGWYLSSAMTSFRKIEPIDLTSLEMHTENGRPYQHFPEEQVKENGQFICCIFNMKNWSKSGRKDLIWITVAMTKRISYYILL
jgi:hypothetical protein